MRRAAGVIRVETAEFPKRLQLERRDAWAAVWRFEAVAEVAAANVGEVARGGYVQLAHSREEVQEEDAMESVEASLAVEGWVQGVGGGV